MGRSQNRYKGKRSKTGGVNNNKPSKPKAWVDAPKDWEPQGDYTGVGSGDGGPGKYPSGTKSTGKSKGGKGGKGGGKSKVDLGKVGTALTGAGKAISDLKDTGLGYSPSATNVRSGASKGATTIDPWRSFTTESGSANDNN